ncbi:hypothetical protein [Gulosibacter sp. 10]|uniref:hypothetical protein n=1 Tax=Gulosibacter sp. 10 TaxID=1255570 RepID=UPI00097F3092|nr:hypothetical protein [Gulosibacter sp. 10]SJM49347.1 putative integral membrane protein [Gulosibacter sp. 10]
MTAAVAYCWAVLFHGQRWMPPVLGQGVIAWLLLGSPPVDASAVAAMLALSLPAVMWLAYSACCAEDAGQEEIAISAMGSFARMLVARGLAAAGAVVPVPLLVIAVGAVSSGLPAAAGALAFANLLLILAAGAGIGVLLGALAPARPGWALLAIVLIMLLAVVVPHAPPVRIALEALLSPSAHACGAALLRNAASVPIAVLAVGLATVCTRRSR